MVFSASSDSCHQGLLDSGVEVVVCCHELHPESLQHKCTVGLKLLGALGSVLSDSLPRRQSIPTFHCNGNDEVDQQALNRWSSTGMRDGQFDGWGLKKPCTS